MNWKRGDRVQIGEPGSVEHDTGTVIRTGGNSVLVHWDKAEESYEENADDLRPEDEP